MTYLVLGAILAIVLITYVILMITDGAWWAVGVAWLLLGGIVGSTLLLVKGLTEVF